MSFILRPLDKFLAKLDFASLPPTKNSYWQLVYYRARNLLLDNDDILPTSDSSLPYITQRGCKPEIFLLAMMTKRQHRRAQCSNLLTLYFYCRPAHVHRGVGENAWHQHEKRIRVMGCFD
jgi:hypothetical protein